MVIGLLNRYRAAYSGLPREVWLLAWALFVNRSGAMVLAFLTIYLTSQREMSAGAAGRMLGVYGLGAILGAWLSGRYTDQLGAIRIQTVCLFLSVPGFLLIPLCHHPISIAASIFYLGLVSEAVRPANAAAVTRLTTPANRARAFALTRLAVNLGFSIGPAVGGLLASIDFGLLFVVDALTTLLAAVVLLASFRMRKIECEEGSSNGTRVASPLKDGVFVTFSLLMLLVAIVFLQLGSTYPLYLRDHFLMATWMIGLMFGVNTLVIVAFEMLLVDFVKAWPLMRTIGLGACLACTGMGILPLGASTAFCVTAMLILTLGEMLVFPMSTAFVGNRSPRGAEGRYMGWYTITFSLASVLAPTLGATIYDINRDALWYICLAVGFIASTGLYALSSRVAAV